MTRCPTGDKPLPELMLIHFADAYTNFVSLLMDTTPYALYGSGCAVLRNSVAIRAGQLQMCDFHYADVIMGAIASQITSLAIVYSTVYSDADQRKHQSSASLAFVWGIHRRPVNSSHKWPVTRKMFPFDNVIMRVGQFQMCDFPRCIAAVSLVTFISQNVIYRFDVKWLQSLDISRKYSNGTTEEYIQTCLFI